MQADMAAIRQILLRDPIWSVYALADLQPAFAPYCRWTMVDGVNGAAVLLLFSALQPPIFFATGDTEAVTEALAGAELPDRLYVTLRPVHYALLDHYYQWVDVPHHMVRMVLREHLPVPQPDVPNLVRLLPGDAAAIAALYAHGGAFTPDSFDAYQLDDGVFYGVRDDQGALVAVGGTHIIAHAERMAAIGNMYTHPAHRGKGYARAVLSAIIADLQAHKMRTIVLNVDENNGAARRIYERYGFRVHCSLIEVEGIKRVG